MTTAPARRVESFDDLTQAGDYCLDTVKDGDDRTKQAVWFLLPLHEGETKFDRPTRGSGLHMITSPPWTFRECDDGSIEIRASIACGRHEEGGEYFHGYLDEGNIWRIL